jgi:hypothetical protein
MVQIEIETLYRGLFIPATSHPTLFSNDGVARKNRYKLSTFISSHPSNHMMSGTRVHVHEGLRVDDASTKMRCDDLESCCFAYRVLAIYS